MTTNIVQLHVSDHPWKAKGSMSWKHPDIGPKSWVEFGGTSYTTKVTEPLGVSDSSLKRLNRKFESKLGLKEARFQKDARKEIQLLLKVLDVRSASFSTRVNEVLKMVDLSSSKPIKGFSSKLNVDSHHGKGYAIDNKEKLGLKDSISRTVDFIRAIAEVVKVKDAVAKGQTVRFSEEFKTIDSILRRADVILVDMVLSELTSDEDFDSEDFERLMRSGGGVPGYTNWRDFIPGDYEYSKALLRTIIESKTADRAQIQQLEVAVDVPDLHDRGTVIVTNATVGGVVEYNKEFHIIPDVTLSAKGGLNNPTVPEFLVAPNLNGFTVRLRDTITGDYVKGSFTWAAIGY